MSPLPVVQHNDTFAYGALCLQTGLMVNQLRFETSPKATHRRVVEVIAFAEQRNPETKLLQDCLVLFSTILTATNRMVNGSRSRTVLLHGSK